MEKADFAIGDWVRFIRDGELVIAEVNYIRDTSFLHEELITDCGAVPVENVLEVRGTGRGRWRGSHLRLEEPRRVEPAREE